jgi:hypothetical protein
MALDGLERRRQRQREQAAQATVDKARQLVAVGDLTHALNILHAFTPAHAVVDDAIREITATRIARDEKRHAPTMVPPREVVLDASSPLEVTPAWPPAAAGETTASQPAADPDAPIGWEGGAAPGTRFMPLPPEWKPDAGEDALGTPVAVVAPPAISRLSMGLVGSLAVVVLVVAIGIWWQRSPSRERAAVTAGTADRLPQTQAVGAERRLSVNAVPWASVRLVAAGAPDSSARQLTTPFTVVLPEGEYKFEFTHPQFGSVVRQVDLRKTEPPPLVVTMPQANVEQILDDVLGKQ